MATTERFLISEGLLRMSGRVPWFGHERATRAARNPKAIGPVRSGLTLAELIVVLVILAAVAAVAVQSLAPVAEQGRYEATKRSLGSFRAAIVGDPNSADAITGFVADTGRLPLSLNELMIRPEDQSTFGLQQAPPELSTAIVPRGWRGPYLMANPGGSLLVDGWGKEWNVTQPSIDSLRIASQAIDRPESPAEYQFDLSVVVLPSDWQGTLITGALYATNPNDNQRRMNPTSATWGVVLLGPGPMGVNQGISAYQAQVTSQSGQVSFSIASGLSVGPRVLQVTKNGSPVGNPRFINVRPGATHVVDIQVE